VKTRSRRWPGRASAQAARPLRPRPSTRSRSCRLPQRSRLPLHTLPRPSNPGMRTVDPDRLPVLDTAPIAR